MAHGAKIGLDPDGKVVDQKTYRGMIGSLIYLTASRPDIMFSTCLCARFQAKPKESHLLAVKRIFRYIKGTPYLGLWYPKSSDYKLIAYSDAEFGAEAEYVAAASCCAQVLWMKTQLRDYGMLYKTVPIYCDSKSAIAISVNPVQHTKTKHIDIRYHFIKHHVEEGGVKESDRYKMSSKTNTDPMIQDENVLLEDPSDQASLEMPMPSVPSVGANLSASRRTPNDVFPSLMYILPYKTNNYFVDFDRIKIHPVICAILRGHPIAQALSSCAEVPEVYIQQAWHTITKNELARPHLFELQIDQYDSYLSYKRLRLILELPEPNSRPDRTTYDSFPSEEEVFEGIRNLGYVGTLDKVRDFDKSKLPPVWYALFSVIIRCLTSKHSGMDSASLLYLRLFHAVFYDLHVDYTFIFWTELSKVVHDKLTNKKHKFIPFIRFLKLIIRSILISNPDIPRRLSWPTVPDTEMTYIQKVKRTFDYSMAIPSELIVNYAGPSDESIIEYFMDNEILLEADQEVEVPANQEVEVEVPVSEQEVNKAVEQEVEVNIEHQEVQADVASQQIEDVIAQIATDSPIHDTYDAAIDVSDDDGNQDEDVHDDDSGDDDNDSGDDGDDADQPSIRIYERKNRTPEVIVLTEVVSEDDYVPVNPSVEHLQVDELDTTFDHASASVQSQVPATSLAAIQSSTVPAVEHTSDQARVSSDKFSTLNDVIRQLSEKMDAEKEAQILNLKTFFKGKMPEIDTSVIPPEIPFRRPTGVVLREPSSAVTSTTSPIVSLPFPSVVSMSVGISMSTPSGTSSRSSLHELPISELTDLLYARLLSMSPTQHQDQDLLSLIRNFQPTPPPVPTSDSSRLNALTDEFHAFRSKVRKSFADLKSFMTQAFYDLSNSVQDLVDVMLDNIDLSSMSNVMNFSEQNIENNMQIVVYLDPDFSQQPIDIEDSEAANDMRSYFANFIEINSDDDDDVRFEKIFHVKEEDCDGIVIISDTEDDFVFFEAKDDEITDMLYKDLPSQDEVSETVPDSAPVSTPVVSTDPTTSAPSGTFEVGQSSRAQANVPSESMVPSNTQEEGPDLTRQQRQRNLQHRYMASRLKTAFLEDSQRNIFISRRRPINIYAILGVEKESEAYQYEYLMLIKCQRKRNELVHSPHLIVRVISVTINKLVNLWYPEFEVERRDCKRHIFSEADFTDLSIDDIEFLYDHFRNLYHRTQDVSQALFAIKRFIQRQIRFFRVFDFQMVVKNPYGVVYKNGSNEKCFLRFEEIAHYSDGTLKVIKLQLEQRLKESQRRFLETRKETFLFENDEIRLLKKTLNIIQERLNFRSTLRRLEVSVGLNRIRQREERQ
ncbi:hypothetical protein L6452_38754 [Arctium lappa]|uniref:Uncharacterized protein n=1 Tax=Arctium lappa TaxID=4217 RepID=A0ACB8XQV7_ARCLA|nr:hypothetical protein L6452_38754 [Arctium lappa]